MRHLVRFRRPAGPTRVSRRALAAAVPALVGLSALLPAPAGAVHLPADLAHADRPALAADLLSLGLEEEAELLLRRELAAGAPWPRESLLRLLVRDGRVAAGDSLLSAWGGPESHSRAAAPVVVLFSAATRMPMRWS